MRAGPYNAPRGDPCLPVGDAVLTASRRFGLPALGRLVRSRAQPPGGVFRGQLAALWRLRVTPPRVRGRGGGRGREVGPGDEVGWLGRALLRRGEHEERRVESCAGWGLGATSGHDE